MAGRASPCLEVKVLLILSLAGAGALTVIAYTRLRARSPEAASAAVTAGKQLAAVILLCAQTVEGVVDALQSHFRPRPLYATPAHNWGYRDRDYDFEEDE